MKINLIFFPNILIHKIPQMSISPPFFFHDKFILIISRLSPFFTPLLNWLFLLKRQLGKIANNLMFSFLFIFFLWFRHPSSHLSHFFFNCHDSDQSYKQDVIGIAPNINIFPPKFDRVIGSNATRRDMNGIR